MLFEKTIFTLELFYGKHGGILFTAGWKLIRSSSDMPGTRKKDMN